MNPDQRSLLEDLLQAWFVRIDAGQSPDPAEHCAGHPELEPEFRRLLQRSAAFDGLLAPALPDGGGDAPGAADAVPPPDRLGEYELIAPIGRGGVGEVWLARQTSLRRLVALKLVKSANTDKARRRLRREAEVAASLDHRGIVPIYAVGEQDARAWIAMKWLTGPALDAVGAPLPAERCAAIAAAVARALHEAHRAGIIHRDIKPSNIVLDGDNPCLVDFGLARDGDDVSRTTAAGHVSGTLLYMSPEQLRSGGATETLDARTDIYSLGATLYELLTGRTPFTGDHPGKVIHQILDVDPAPPPVARDLTTIVLRALDKDRERRFRTALEMAEDLERFLAGQPIVSRPVGISTRVWKLALRHRTATALLGGVLLLAIGLGVSFAWTVYERTRLLDSGVARVLQAIASDDLHSAEALLTQLRADDPQAPQVLAAGRQLAASQGLDELLDRVQALPEDADPDELRVAASAVVAADLPAHRRVDYALALPLALAIGGDLAAARASLPAMPEGRAAEAIRAAVEAAEHGWQDRTPWQLRPGNSAQDHLFTAVAMRLAQQPLQDRRVEVDLARRLDAVDPRIRLQHAIQLINERDYRLAQEALFAASRDGRFPRIVRRLMVFAAIGCDDVDGARFHLRKFLEEHPRDTWTAADAAYGIEAFYWLDEPCDALLEFARERWPKDRQVTVLRARALATSDPAAARDLLAASVAMARTDRQRQASQRSALWIEAGAMARFRFPWAGTVDADQEAALLGLARRAAELAATAGSDDLRSSGLWLQARALLAAGHVAQARRVVNGLDANSPAVVLELAQHACCHFVAAGMAAGAGATAAQREALAQADAAAGQAWPLHVRDVRPRLARALEAMPARFTLHGRRAGADGWLLAAQLALADGDLNAAKIAAKTLRDAMRGGDDPGLVTLLDYVEQQIRQRGG